MLTYWYTKHNKYLLCFWIFETRNDNLYFLDSLNYCSHPECYFHNVLLKVTPDLCRMYLVEHKNKFIAPKIHTRLVSNLVHLNVNYNLLGIKGSILSAGDTKIQLQITWLPSSYGWQNKNMLSPWIKWGVLFQILCKVQSSTERFSSLTRYTWRSKVTSIET